MTSQSDPDSAPEFEHNRYDDVTTIKPGFIPFGKSLETFCGKLRTSLETETITDIYGIRYK